MSTTSSGFSASQAIAALHVMVCVRVVKRQTEGDSYHPQKLSADACRRMTRYIISISHCMIRRCSSSLITHLIIHK